MLFATGILLAGCGARVDIETSGIATGGSGAGGSSAGGSGAGGSGPFDCTLDSDCAVPSACIKAACINHQCVAAGPVLDGTPCEDGNGCTSNDFCVNGVCLSGQTNPCPSAGPCMVSFCDEAAKGCVAVPAADGTPCDSTDFCAVGSFCQAGACVGGKPKDCSFLDGPCAVGQCLSGQGCTAVPLPEGTACEDGFFCTQGDTCQNGVCAGGPNPCAPADPCHAGFCSETMKACSFTPANDGAPCNDGNACTSNDQCKNGVCVGTAGGPGTVVFFTDDFHDSSKGWTLGPEWQIGPAMMSSGGSFGGTDPAQDHTTTADNGIAGVVIGGNATTAIHPFYYLTSPPFDTAQATGLVIFTYQRWLVSDFEPWMHSTVDVWNGAQWINLWTNGNMPVSDTAWTFQSFDVTPHKNPKMQIRFGVDVALSSAFSVASWNIDDVVVANGTCP
ncbi:MAG: hypothetical protein QM820_45665 [Minicystis sp.]